MKNLARRLLHCKIHTSTLSMLNLSALEMRRLLLVNSQLRSSIPRPSKVVIPQVLCPSPRDGVLCGSGYDVALEELADALERNALGLGDAEDGVDKHRDAAASEEQVGAEGDFRKHDWCEFGDDEVEQPLCHERGGHYEGAYCSWCQFCESEAEETWRLDTYHGWENTPKTE